MSYTKQSNVTRGAWVLAISGQTSGFVQLKDDGPVLVAIAASLPAVDSEDALELDAEGIRAFSFTDLEITDNVYLRSRHDETNKVVAQSTGTAPA